MVALDKMCPYLYFKVYEETTNIHSHSHPSSISIATQFVVGKRITKLLSPAIGYQRHKNVLIVRAKLSEKCNAPLYRMKRLALN